MGKILDKEIHQLFKSPILPHFYVATGYSQHNNNNNMNFMPPSPPRQDNARQLYNNNSRGFSVSNNIGDNPRRAVENMVARMNIGAEGAPPQQSNEQGKALESGVRLRLYFHLLELLILQSCIAVQN